ncbi:PhzF family phenazine biosynthesis protein [Paenibacillus thailandensis]|uniref:PhzF family phenazine biosynthesis protein n=1 Tax=Paenibacillus thailandensis TaxID=393250 RepID=A0ABW5R3M5_9BACL
MPIYMVDAFASEAFRGNPAAVCLLEKAAEDGWMRQVAAEMNQSETAFVLREEEGWRLRWFTPEREVELCGHATLASAHVLWQTGRLASGAEARFYTHSGLLVCSRTDDGGIEMDFPAEPVEPAQTPPAAIEGLGIVPRYTGRNRMDLLIEADSEETVRTIRPDFGLLKSLDCRGIIVTSRASAGAGYDFVSRFFAPGVGIAEDPVTGSAHCALAPYWGKRLRKEVLTGYQASARGGFVQTRLSGDRLRLTGQAVTVMQGRLEA